MEEIILNTINNYFEKQENNIFSRNKIKEILNNDIGYFKNINRFIKYLLENTSMEEIRLNFPSRPIIRYSWKEIDLMEILLKLKPLSYYSHSSALNLNNLLDSETNVILNFEQPEKEMGDYELIQENIDRVFKGKSRVTKNVTKYKNKIICLVNGKFTNKLGVINKKHKGYNLEYTGIERTLVDIVVRPQYSGGIQNIQKAFVNASGQFSVDKLITILKKIGHKYPYHQAIGYFMQKSNKYKEEELMKIKDLGINYVFYLEYGHKQCNLEFSKDWRIFFPKEPLKYNLYPS